MKFGDLYRNDLIGNFNEFDLFRTNWPRIQNIFEGRVMPPYEVLIHPSSTCNLRCMWCIGQNLHDNKITSNKLDEKLRTPSNMLHILKNIIEYSVEGSYFEDGIEKKKIFKTENVSFSGLVGEPLVSKNSVLLGMNYLVENGIRTGIFTNGLLIDKEVCSVMANISYVLISLDAATNETYCKMKCLGIDKKYNYMEKIIKNICNLQKEKQRIKSDLDINIGYVVNQYNYLEIEDAARLLKSLGVRFFRLKMDIAVKNVLNDDQRELVKQQIQNIKANIEDSYFKLVEIHSISKIMESDQKRLFTQCNINKIFAAVASDGCLYACNYHANPDGIRIGSLLTDDISSLWGSFNCVNLEQCPKVCDPYKNRANNMLSQAKAIYDEVGTEKFQHIVQKVLNNK